MAIAAHKFIHFDLSLAKGDELPDDHPLVAQAPHLFEQPDVVEVAETEPVRIRGPLVDPPKPSKATKNKEA